MKRSTPFAVAAFGGLASYALMLQDLAAKCAEEHIACSFYFGQVPQK